MRTTVRTERPWFFWITTADESVDHAVGDDAIATGLAAGRGEYRALCGARFPVAALVSPPAPACPRCATDMRAQASLAAPMRRHRTGLGRTRRNAGRHRAR